MEGRSRNPRKSQRVHYVISHYVIKTPHNYWKPQALEFTALSALKRNKFHIRQAVGGEGAVMYISECRLFLMNHVRK